MNVAADTLIHRTPMRTRVIDFLADYGFIVFFIGWIIFLSIFTDTFLTERNIPLLLRQASIYAIPAIGATFVILLGELDISFGSVIGVAGVTAAELLIAGYDPLIAIGGAVLIGALVGVVNGTLVTFFRIPSVVATLGMLSVVLGIGLVYTQGHAITGPALDPIDWLAGGYLGIIPVPVVLMFVGYAIAWFVLNRTPFGAHVYLVGDNREAAFRAGIAVNRIRMAVFIAAGALAGLGGVVLGVTRLAGHGIARRRGPVPGADRGHPRRRRPAGRPGADREHAHRLGLPGQPAQRTDPAARQRRIPARAAGRDPDRGHLARQVQGLTMTLASPPMSFPNQLIDGRWVAPSSGRLTPVHNPSNGELLAEVPAGDLNDLNAAVAAARRAFDEGPWPRMAASERGRYLLRIAAIIERDNQAIAELETLNNGKPIRESSRIDVPLSADCFEYWAGFATKITGETLPVPGDVLSYTLREPLGVVGAITPFNFPLLLASWKLGPALAAGNTVVIKPASDTPLTTLRLGEICQEAGLPPGVVNVVIGDSKVGQALVEHPDVDKITFTGSTDVGKQIAAGAAGNLKRVSLELGGKAPNIVFADAPLEDAVAGALFGVYWTQGQICTAGSRLLVQRPIFDAFVGPLHRAGRSAAHGRPARHADRRRAAHLGHPLLARHGAHPLRPRARAPGFSPEASSRPTRPSRAATTSRRPSSSTSGPRCASRARRSSARSWRSCPSTRQRKRSAIANDTIFGLTAGVWTRDVKLAHRVARAIRAGTIWVNMYNVVTSEAPFGGFRQSGWGRENGPHAIDSFTEVKNVYVNLAERSTDWFAEDVR